MALVRHGAASKGFMGGEKGEGDCLRGACQPLPCACLTSMGGPHLSGTDMHVEEVFTSDSARVSAKAPTTPASGHHRPTNMRHSRPGTGAVEPGHWCFLRV